MTNFSLFSGPAVETEKKYHAKRKKKKTGSDLKNDLTTPRQLLKKTMVLNKDFFIPLNLLPSGHFPRLQNHYSILHTWKKTH